MDNLSKEVLKEPTSPIYIVAKDNVILPIDGKQNKRLPESIYGTQGWDEGLPFDCSTVNYIWNNHGEWVEYLRVKVATNYSDLKQYIDTKHKTAMDAISSLGTALTTKITTLDTYVKAQVKLIRATTLTAGSGIDGGGDLTADRSFSVDNTVIRTTGNQTLGGIKTFSSAPETSASQGSKANNLTRKDYVDAQVKSTNTVILSTPIVVLTHQDIGGSKEVVVPNSIPEGAVCFVNFRATAPNEGAESFGLIASGGTSNISDANQANVYVQFYDGGSRTYASSGQVMAKKVGGKIRISKTGGVLKASLAITGYMPQRS